MNIIKWLIGGVSSAAQQIQKLVEQCNFCSKIPGFTETGGVGDDYCAFVHRLPLMPQAKGPLFFSLQKLGIASLKEEGKKLIG